MSSRFDPREDPGLFDDLPLHKKPEPRSTPPEAKQEPKQPGSSPEPLPLFTEDAKPLTTDDVEAAVTRPAWRPIVPFAALFKAGLIDLGIVLGVMLAVWAGLWWLDIDVDLVGRALVLVFLLPFSFLYQIFPLAFWGCTPGMAKVGVVARNVDGQGLSFSQAVLRWLASLLTVATAGLPLILTATSGRSLADRLSGSQTRPAR